MANLARKDQEQRTIQVNRKELLNKLRTNRLIHIQEYKQALAGYKDSLQEKMEEAFKKAAANLSQKYTAFKDKLEVLSDEEILKQPDSITLIDEVWVEMKVPKSYEKEYDAAIDMVNWDVRDVLELTHAEFTCFVRDQWDWTSSFSAISKIYIK